ncbi:hypothetical protein Tco_0055087 [Tanacetum coccineum]
METLEALGSICNADVIPCKVSYVDDSINLNVDESTIPSDPIVQFVDINKSTSYAGVTGGSAKDQPNVNSNFCTLVADPVFDGVNISIPRKVVEKEQLGETWAEKDYDEFQRLHHRVYLYYCLPSKVFRDKIDVDLIADVLIF